MTEKVARDIKPHLAAVAAEIENRSHGLETMTKSSRLSPRS